MTDLKTVYEYAREYTGASDLRKGDVILDFLCEEGLRSEHYVLEIGCGCLAEGGPLMGFLDTGHYLGVDPNGWLIRAALDQYPALLTRVPRFALCGDFDIEGEFDVILAHSVLSHVSRGQLLQALRNIRRNVRDGGIWLASLRIGEDDYDDQWRYPDVSFFSAHTLEDLGTQTGWSVEHVPEYCERLSAVCPDDIHDWIRLVAT